MHLLCPDTVQLTRTKQGVTTVASGSLTWVWRVRELPSVRSTDPLLLLDLVVSCLVSAFGKGQRFAGLNSCVSWTLQATHTVDPRRVGTEEPFCSVAMPGSGVGQGHLSHEKVQIHHLRKSPSNGARFQCSRILSRYR